MIDQMKRHSLMEAATNIIVGIALSWLLTFFVMPFWGFNPTIGQALEVTAVFTVVSFARSYALRRIFNHWHISIVRKGMVAPDGDLQASGMDEVREGLSMQDRRQRTRN